MEQKARYAAAVVVFMVLLISVFLVERMPVVYSEKSDTLYLPQLVSKEVETAMNVFERADSKKDNIISHLQDHIPGLAKKIDEQDRAHSPC